MFQASKYDKTVCTVNATNSYPYFAGRYSYALDYVEINGKLLYI